MRTRISPFLRYFNLGSASLAACLLLTACGEVDDDPWGTGNPGGGDPIMTGDGGAQSGMGGATPGGAVPGGQAQPGGGTAGAQPGGGTAGQGQPGGGETAGGITGGATTGGQSQPGGGTPGGATTGGGTPGGATTGGATTGGGTPGGATPGGATTGGGTPGGGTPGGAMGSESDYKDPGKGAWVKGTPAECKMDIGKLADSGLATYAVFRYGKLCHMKGSDAAGSMFSATKTLGGVTVGRAAYLTKDIARTGPGTGTILHEDKATDWLGNVSYNRNALLSHVMSMCGHSSNLDYGRKQFTYDTIGTTQINTMIQVAEKAIKQVPGSPSSFTAFMQKEIFDKMGMTRSSYSAALGISTGWSANLSDMGKLGTLLIHDGWYGGERLLSRKWVYRMSHPAHEDANTSYGQLAWLNHRGNAAGIGGNISTGANAKEGDPCAPAAFWPSYPSPSGAPDCRATVGTCKQTYDVGVFSAQGLNGQFIVMHPGLDLVIVARNFSGGDGPLGMWKAVRPAVVAMDPMFKGDEAAFCKAYGAGDYAPDLIMPRGPDL